MADFYFCMTHHEVEAGRAVAPLDRMGPYPSALGRSAWQESVEARNEAGRRGGPRGQERLTRIPRAMASLAGP